MKFTIKKEELAAINGANSTDFPKYTSQLINLANQNAQGTRPNAVGQLSDLFPQYVSESKIISLEGWQAWYEEHYPNAIDNATDRIFAYVDRLSNAIKLIDRDLVRDWVEDLIITKTYNGLHIQKAILMKLAEKRGQSYQMATPTEESKGIDGYVGGVAYSVKPDTYKIMGRLSEDINVKMVYYSKKNGGLIVEVED